MIQTIDGDIFDSGADIIVHQTNCMGVMGSGIAKQVRNKFPHVYAEYLDFCSKFKDKRELLGKILVCKATDDLLICNMFGQLGYGRDGKCYTDYESIRTALNTLNHIYIDKNIAFPYKMSCDLGGGNWETVSSIIEETIVDNKVTFYKFNGR